MFKVITKRLKNNKKTPQLFLIEGFWIYKLLKDSGFRVRDSGDCCRMALNPESRPQNPTPSVLRNIL